jgi:hypothetical protein
LLAFTLYCIEMDSLKMVLGGLSDRIVGHEPSGTFSGVPYT